MEPAKGIRSRAWTACRPNSSRRGDKTRILGPVTQKAASLELMTA